MTSEKQRIILPWETREWATIKTKFTSECINSIIDMDSRIASMHGGRLKPRQINELFNLYYNSDRICVPKDEFIEKILPMMQKFIENAPKTFKGFDSSIIFRNIVLNRIQVATLITCMWFGLFEYNYISKGVYSLEDFPEPTFIKIFTSQNLFAVSCLLNYFKRVYDYINGDADTTNMFSAGNIIIQRNKLICTKWPDDQRVITEIFIGEGHIDDSPAKMHVVYAHEFIGGGMFKEGLTPEEVLILIRPECITATLFCLKIAYTDTVTIMGAEKMSQYSGYGSSVSFAGNYIDGAPKGYSTDETEVMLQHAAIFMDSTPKTSGIAQYVSEFDRDLNKAYCGFRSLNFRGQVQISTGNWTYGFSGSGMQVKFIQQVLAASAANKCLVYHPFGRDFEDRLLPFINWLRCTNKTIAQIYNSYTQLIKDSYSHPQSKLADLDIFNSMMEQ